MTHRERIVRTLTGESVDRPCLCGWLGFLPWGATQGRWRKESGLADLDVWKYFGFESEFNGAAIACGACPGFEPTVIKKTTEYVLAVSAQGLTVRQQLDDNAMMEFMAHPVRSRTDWERYKAERLQLRLQERTSRLDEWAENAKTIDAPVQVGSYPWGVFGTLRDMLGAEETLVAFYDDPDMVRDVMETFVTLWLALYEEVCKRVRVDHIHIWEDMSGRQGSLISMKMVEEFMMPQYDRIADFARRHAIPLVSVDTDGKVDELLPVMMRHGVNVFMPFEVQAGNDVELIRTEYPTLGIMGGLDKNALARGKAEINIELGRAERMLARGRYIAGFDHLIPPNVPWENFRYFVDNLRRIIGI